MNTSFVYDTFERWISKPTPPSLRRGQYLFNEAPPHITTFLKQEVGYHHAFDPFELDWEFGEGLIPPTAMRFIMLCMLCWDEEDQEELQKAYELILQENPPD